MVEAEGVIKYQLDFNKNEPTLIDLTELNTWRNILHGLALIGQNPARYLGYGYGNLSCRDIDSPNRFVISASQTGSLDRLDNSHYTTVEECDFGANRVVAHGPLPPSSEALTHAMIYQQLAPTSCVMHVHDPKIWRYGLERGLPQTDASCKYGSVEMAREVSRLCDQQGFHETGLLFMAGHEDGLLTFGDSIEQAGSRMVRLWVEANLW